MSELKQWAETASDGTDYVLAYADGLYCVTDSKGNVVCEFIRAEPEARALTPEDLSGIRGGYGGGARSELAYSIEKGRYISRRKENE